MNDRQEKIVEMMENGKSEITLKELKETFDTVSDMTLRRDLITLEKEGFLIRAYGKAIKAAKVSGILKQEDDYSIRASENTQGKQAIAEAALTFAEKGRSVFLDAGTTIMCLARLLDDDNYSILTNGLNIAVELVKKNRISVVVLGGQVGRNSLSASGPYADSFVENINIDIAFMASSGFSLESGFTVGNIYECELKRKIVKRARKVILLMDTSKINKNLPFTYGTLKDIDVWITEKPLPDDIAGEAQNRNVEMIYAAMTGKK
jgi:DeoR/GlpR family transcriptional regulator of sugar metabolism